MGRRILFLLVNGFLIFSGCVFSAQGQEKPEIFRDPGYPVPVRVDDLVSRLTLEEKVQQMQNDAPAIVRLGIPAYNWWNECLHGVARNGIATVFPQAIGMAATWSPELIGSEADVISTEARAKYNAARSSGKTGLYQGLTFWSPNINIFRDPRWGRGQETYGEDPYLTSRIGVAFVKGLQGNDPKYLKVISTAKHFAVHSGPEPARHSFDAWCSEQDLYETYLPAFEALIREGKAYSVMGAYNRLFNVPCCASDLLLENILRKKWDFGGYVVSDCGAIWDIYHGHGLVHDSIKASVLGVKAGCDLTCGDEYSALTDAVKKGYVSEEIIDRSVKRLFTARFRLGMFDPENAVPYNSIPFTENDKDESRMLARKVAQQSMVLLKNENHTLPLSGKIRSIAVTGPYADKLSVLMGNYHGTASKPVTFLSGIRNRAGGRIIVKYAKGVSCLEDAKNQEKMPDARTTDASQKEALDLALTSDVVIFVGGISPNLEGEEMEVDAPGFSGGDRTSLNIPDNQAELLKKLKATGKPVILVLTGGGALSINWAKDNLPAIVEVWYPGEEGGNALADVLFGETNPGGKLPVTFYKSVTDLPAFEDYSMKGRTYRYFSGEPLYPFGYGLSYTSFSWLSVDMKRSAVPSDTVVITVKLKNSGDFDGDEVIQVYAKRPENGKLQPVKSLLAFQRVSMKKGEERLISIPMVVGELRQWDYSKEDYTVDPGIYDILIGSSSADIRLKTKLQVSDK